MGLPHRGQTLSDVFEMVPPHPIDTKNPSAVAGMVKEVFKSIGAETSGKLIDRLFADNTDMFTGRYPGYQGSDMKYHNHEHTMQAAVCLVHLLEGRNNSTDKPVLTVRDWELALMSALLHDCGYLKATDDREGTGAKYTFVHERRSCDFARQYLPRMGATSTEIEDICAAILCTGPQSKLSQITFHREEARLYAFLLVTADYLAQMSAADYVPKLPHLFLEFQEAYEFEGIAPEKRLYRKLDEMLAMTPNFWERIVKPLLDFEAGGVHRYLATVGQPNPYLQAVEANIAEVRRLVQAGSGRT
jgi:predicted metal-dependent HD superfamily phosphohydrolase